MQCFSFFFFLSFFPTFALCLSDLIFRRRVSQMGYWKRPSQNWAQSTACNSFGPLSDGLRAVAMRRLGPLPEIIRESPYRWAPFGLVARLTLRIRVRVRVRPTVTHITRWWVPVPGCQRCIKNEQQIRKKVRQQIVVAKHLFHIRTKKKPKTKVMKQKFIS